MQTPVRVVDFHKAYQQRMAVEGMSFDVEAGEILGLLGPNGAGKTTTLRAICGIIPPTSGQIFVAGHEIVADPIAAKRQVAYIPDDPHLFDTLTVWEHLMFAAAAYRVPDAAARSEQLLQRFGLLERRDTVTRELSRGMQQKVAICCAYLHAPVAILFDEPLTGLDPLGIRELKHSIREQAARGSAVIISSHLLSLIEDLCTRLLILHEGHKLFHGDLASARQAFPDLRSDSTLEEVFFRATQSRRSE